MTLNEQHSRKDHILHIARGMMAAARTAPKAKGVDNLEIVTVTGDDLPRLAQKMRAMSEENGFKFFLRDANNVEQSDAVVVIGTRLGVFNLNCGMCGFPTCADKSQFESVPCAFNTNDLGIALGSAAGHAGGPTVCGPGNISGRSAPPPQGAGGGGAPRLGGRPQDRQPDHVSGRNGPPRHGAGGGRLQGRPRHPAQLQRKEPLFRPDGRQEPPTRKVTFPSLLPAKKSIRNLDAKRTIPTFAAGTDQERFVILIGGQHSMPDKMTG